MNNNQLTIVWKPDVLHMMKHRGSFEEVKDERGWPVRIDSNRLGLTARSETETFRNIKSLEAAKKILLKRDVRNIIVAKYNGEPIFVTPEKKQRKKFVKKQKRKMKAAARSIKYTRKIK